MADVKWIKITTDIFDDEKILLIESLPEAYAIITCWFKLLCLAGKQNNRGVFLMNDKIAYTDKMLATIFRMKETTVQLALKTFEEFGMIELVDGVITIPKWEKHQSLDKLEEKKKYDREYQARKRQEKRLLIENRTTSLTMSNDNRALDKEEDKEEDKEIKSKRFIKPTLNEVETYITENNLNVNAQQWLDYYESNGFMVGRNHMKDWKACVRRWSNTNEKEKPTSTLPKYEYTNKAKSLSRKEIERELAKAGKL